MRKQISMTAALLLAGALAGPALAVPTLGQSPRHKQVAEKKTTAAPDKPGTLKLKGRLLRVVDGVVYFLPAQKAKKSQAALKPRKYCLKMDEAKLKPLIKRGGLVQVRLQAGRGQLCLVGARALGRGR